MSLQSQAPDPINVRVQRSLKRVGFDNISVKDLGDGAVELQGTVAIGFDIALANYVASTVPGVIRIAHQLRASNQWRVSKDY
jgi:hypothetical protein